MKYLFLTCLAVLVTASVATYRMSPEASTDVPVLYWVTDPNPAREEQVAIFHRWLEKNNFPRFELRVDTANMRSDKVVIQAVSGVCADIIGHCGGANMRFRHAVGILEDVTEWGLELGFDPSRTYPAMEPEITVGDRQFAFPCNVYAHMLWVNKDTFERFGVPVPPPRWTFEEFEHYGKQFVAAANPAGQPRRFFFCNQVDETQMARSLGLSRFNETMTACTLDDPRMIRVLKLKYRWTYTERIIPSLADIQSFSSEHGYGGLDMQLFNSGNYAMFKCGRYALIQLREFQGGRMQLAVVEPAHGGYPNTSTGTRAAAIYRGGRYKHLARYFLAYLASEDYNMQIVRDADALPPNPEFTRTTEFLRPADYPNEWGCHEMFVNAMDEIAIPATNSPFILDAEASRLQRTASEAFMSDRMSAEEAAADMAERINEQIRRNLREDPKQRPTYDDYCDIQARIEAYRREGRPVPREWIKNPFYRKYYADMGWVE